MSLKVFPSCMGTWGAPYSDPGSSGSPLEGSQLSPVHHGCCNLLMLPTCYHSAFSIDGSPLLRASLGILGTQLCLLFLYIKIFCSRRDAQWPRRVVVVIWGADVVRKEALTGSQVWHLCFWLSRDMGRAGSRGRLLPPKQTSLFIRLKKNIGNCK